MTKKTKLTIHIVLTICAEISPLIDPQWVDLIMLVINLAFGDKD